MRQETTASSLPSALHNFWTSQTVLVKIKLRWRLQTYWTLLFCERWQWNWRPVWVSQWGAGSCESLFQEAAAVWHGLLFTGLNMQSTWKDLGELEERQWKWVRGLAAKKQENLLAMWAEAADFHHGMFLLTAGDTYMSQAVWLAQKGFFGPAYGKKDCEAGILQSDKSFMTRHVL